MGHKKVSVSYLRGNLKEIIQAVEKGQTIVIESHGREIAELKPLENKRLKAREKLLEIGKKTKMGDVITPTGEKWNIAL